MKVLNLLKNALFFALITWRMQSLAQSASGIGFSYGFNRPFSGDYNLGNGWQLFGDIRVGNRFEIVPCLGGRVAQFKSRVYQIGQYSTKHIDNIGLVYLGVSGKYYFNRSSFGFFYQYLAPNETARIATNTWLPAVVFPGPSGAPILIEK